MPPREGRVLRAGEGRAGGARPRLRGGARARGARCDRAACACRAPASTATRGCRGRWTAPRPLYVPFGALARCRRCGPAADDVVIFQRPMTELPTTLFERWAARGRRSIFDFDDAIYERRGVRGKFRRWSRWRIAWSRATATWRRPPRRRRRRSIIPHGDRHRPLRGAADAARARARRRRRLDGAVGQLPAAGARRGRASRARSSGRARASSPSPIGRRRKSLAALRPEFVPWRAETRGRGSGAHRRRRDAAARRRLRARQVRVQAAAVHGAGAPGRRVAGGRQRRRRHPTATTDSCRRTTTAGTRR